MSQAAPQFPAVMVFREKGEILFLDRRACELTGYDPGEHRDLREMLASLFPDGRDQASAVRLFRRAAAAAGRRGAARFQAEFSSKHGRPRRTLVQVQRWDGTAGDRSYLVSLLPSEAPAESLPGEDRAAVCQAVVRRVSRLLKEATVCSGSLVTDGDPSDGRLNMLSALIERAQGLLGSLEAQAQDGSQWEGRG